MRKPYFCLCENEGADQLLSSAKLISAFILATLILQFLSSSNTKNFQILAFFCDCTRFVSDLFGNLKDWFSAVAAHSVSYWYDCEKDS